jgi:two-component system, NarL family, nitrate/nitrite response regulator NarL
MSWRIIIVDDHQLVLDGLTRIVKTAANFELLATAGNGKELLQLLPGLQQKPHVILMDIDMPFINGIETAKLVKKDFPAIKILMLTMHEENVYYNKVVAAQADGLMMKSAGQAELLAALQKVCNGGTFFSEKIKNTKPGGLPINQDEVSLTEREIAVLKKIALGMSNTEIADAFGISVRTVDTHRTNLKKKLAVNGIAGLVRYAYEKGLLAP